MKERPILFSGPMVRALLAGTKTQTRRIVKPWEPRPGTDAVPADVSYLPDFTCYRATCPYGQPGDRLYVRETWAYGIHALAAQRDEDGPFVYAADGTTHGRLCDRWRPSIHMPRHACRLVLEITGVRVERLQDISEADILAEGVTVDRVAEWCNTPWSHMPTLHHAWRVLWESINGAGSWATNPWVWVLEWPRLEGQRPQEGRGNG